MIKPGEVYRHMKGHKYRVISIGMHTELNELMVIYKRVTGPDIIWIRPLAMFEEVVMHEGRMQPRFELTNAKE